MSAPAKRIEISEEDRAELTRIARSGTEEVRMVERAEIVLGAAEGHSAVKIGSLLGCSANTAQKWRARYERDGLAGLRDLPRSGKPLTFSQAVRARLIAKACTRPAATPECEERLGDVCGRYVNPPENVLVVSLDEKTGIQAKAPTKPDMPPAAGRPARREHEYKRNGTQCLFAALKVHEGDVLAMPSKTRNRFDLIRFLDLLDAEIPVVDDQKIVAVSDNLSTRGTQEVKDWLEAHPRWSFQFTPTHASWLNQIEIFFSILYRRLLKHGMFTSEEDLAEQMLAFIETYNQTAKPFKWTYTGKTLEV